MLPFYRRDGLQRRLVDIRGFLGQNGPRNNPAAREAEMDTRDLDRIRFVTRHFNDLQGLRLAVPLGLITLSWASPAPLRIFMLLGALLLALGAKRYYGDAFGEVEQPPVDPATELTSVSIFSPAGPISRLEFRQVTPVARHFLVTLALAMVVFWFFQSLPPNILIQQGASPGQLPRIIPAPAYETDFERSFVHGETWLGVLPIKRPDTAMNKASFTRMTYALYGSLFLGVWLWRERRWSQSHHLVLAVLLLGLSILGTFLGFFASPDGKVPPDVGRFLPALIYPGMALLFCGYSMILMGLLDHWQLVRTLGWPVAAREEDLI